MKNDDIVKSEAQEFYKYGIWKDKQIIPTAKNLNADLKLELGNHQVADQIVYLEEIIRLIDIDAQEHLKTCKMKDHPNDCLDNQFYAKSKYYAKQILDSIVKKNESVSTKYEFNRNLSKETLSVISDLLNGEEYPLTKDSPHEVSAIIERLNNLGFLNKVNVNDYTMNRVNRKYLVKLLEFESWNKYEDWLSKEKDSHEASIINIFNGSSVGQINQAIGNSTIQNTESKTQSSLKTSWLNKLYWVIGIIVSFTIIYEFVIKHFMK